METLRSRAGPHAVSCCVITTANSKHRRLVDALMHLPGNIKFSMKKRSQRGAADEPST
jgi:hypothetical protein